MKTKHILIALATLCMASCFDDDSTYGSDSINIEISDIEDIYNIVSYSGEPLVISPSVTSNFMEDDLEYEWSYFNTATTAATKQDTLRPTVISRSKVLNYEPMLEDGTYNFYFRVKSKSTGYSVADVTTVYASSALSKGFYVLKETADGDSDVDLYNTDQAKVIADVFEKYMGGAVKGRPVHLDIIGNMSYLDSIKGKPAADNLLSIVTDNNGGDVKWVRARDAKIVKCFDDCHYEPAEGEVPYRTVRVSSTEFFLTNTGVYTASVNYGTGIFGAATYGTEASGHVTSTKSYQTIFWQPKTHSIKMVDYNGASCSVLSRLTEYEDIIKYRVSYVNGYECLYCGQNQLGYADELIVFIMQSNTDDERVMFNMTSTYSNASLNSVRAFTPDSHMAKAEKYAICGRQARLLYGLEGNSVYALDLSNTASTEEVLTFEGLDASEKITYIANKYAASGVNTFDYLVVGTQTGDSYKLYFYNTLGGKPDGKWQFVINGKGRMKNVEYTDPFLKNIVASSVQDD